LNKLFFNKIYKKVLLASDATFIQKKIQ